MQKILAILLLAFSAVTPVALNAQQPAGSDWSRVQQTQPGTLLRIASHRRPAVCNLAFADSDSLTCTQTRTFLFVPVARRLFFNRQEITSIKLSRQPLSLITGAAIGAGAGAGIGAAIDAGAKDQIEEGHLVTVVGAILGFAIGSGVGSKADFLAGPTIYRAP